MPLRVELGSAAASKLNKSEALVFGAGSVRIQRAKRTDEAADAYQMVRCVGLAARLPGANMLHLICSRELISALKQ